MRTEFISAVTVEKDAAEEKVRAEKAKECLSGIMDPITHTFIEYQVGCWRSSRLTVLVEYSFQVKHKHILLIGIRTLCLGQNFLAHALGQIFLAHALLSPGRRRPERADRRRVRKVPRG